MPVSVRGIGGRRRPCMDRLKAIALVVAGLFAIGAGVFGVNYEVTDVDEVMCGEQVMRPGHRCADNSSDAHFGAGRGYEAMRRDQIANKNSFYNVVGIAAVVAGLVMIGIGGYRLRPRASTAGGANHPPAQPPWNPPPAPGPGSPPNAAGSGQGERGRDALVRVVLDFVCEGIAGVVVRSQGENVVRPSGAGLSHGDARPPGLRAVDSR